MKRRLEDIDDKYEVYSDGYVINTKTNKIVVFNKSKKGYMKARLYSPLSKNPDGRKPYTLHRLIAKAFLPDYSDNLQVNHKNGIKDDNRVENLEMVTNAQNALHAWTFLDENNNRRKNLKRNEKGQFIKKNKN
jgi:hypothetical protein